MHSSCKLIPDFIIPNLENATYGHHLQWEDKAKGAFKVSRIHQSSERWNDDCIKVYQAWSQKKHLWNLDDPKRITKAKHRLITALRRNPEIEMLKKEAYYYRFRVIDYHTGKNFSNETSEETLEKSVKEKKGEGNIEPNEESSRNLKKQAVDFKNAQSKNNYENLKTFENLPLHESAWTEKDEVILSLKPHEIFYDMYYSPGENSSSFSDKCCCDILLDSNFLCNKMCIWHGIPP